MTTSTPVPYSPSVETIADDEPQTIQELDATLLKISETVYADSGHAARSVHLKSHGILRGELRVLDSLQSTLAQGAFIPGKAYPVVIRFSTSPGDDLPDTVSTPRGMALKLIGVEGDRLPGSEDDVTQDFVMVNGPVFSAPDAKHFLKNLKLLAATTDKAAGAKDVLSSVLRGAEKVIEALGGESSTLKSLGAHPLTNLLGETFYSQVPMRWGDCIAKVCVAPVSPGLIALKDQVLDLKDHPNGIREAVSRFFATGSAEWEVRVQLCTDLEKMPIEDATVQWPEDLSPYLPVARILVPMQTSWDPATSPGIEDKLSFSPWHGLADHRPLGSVMRARKPAYEASANFRGQRNGCPMHQPATLADAVGPTG